MTWLCSPARPKFRPTGASFAITNSTTMYHFACVRIRPPLRGIFTHLCWWVLSQTGDFIADFWVMALSLLLPDTLWADDICPGLPHSKLHFSTQRNHRAPAEFAFLAGAGDMSLGGELGQWRETISTFSLALDNCSVLPEGQHPTNDYFICWLIFTMV